MSPRRGECVAIALAAVLIRVLFFLSVTLCRHISLPAYANLYDGHSYLVTARAMLGDRNGFDDFQGRVFPGFPAMIALAHEARIPLPAAAVGINWIAAGIAAALAAALFDDRRVGWAIAFLIPHYLMNSSLALSEAPLLAFTLTGLYLAARRRTVAGGTLLGAAGLIRPMACFALAGCLFVQIKQGRWRAGLATAGAASLLVCAGLLLLQHWRGDAWAGVRYYVYSPNAYGGHLLTWPFRSLLLVPIERHVSPWRVAYLWAHAIAALAACALLARAFLAGGAKLDWRDALTGLWLWSNTLFALCIGSVWGFECFHRFTIPALPAMFWGLRTILPGRILWWIPVAAVSFLIALLSLLHDLNAIA
jgi:hypothetical protein